MFHYEESNESLFALAWGALFGRARSQEQDAAAYRRLALQLHYDAARGGARSAMVVSPTASALPAPGALTLATSLAQELGHSVLLVDACAQRPDVTRLLGVEALPGWADWSDGNAARLEALVLPTSTEGLWFLPAGAAGAVHSAAALESIAAALHKRFDFVLIAGGAVLDEGAGLGLLAHVGCVLLMVTENETKIEELKSAQEALRLCKAEDVRIVLTSPVKGREARPAAVRVQPRAHAQAVGKLAVE